MAAQHLWVLAAALVLDRIVGDPVWLWSRAPHPVAIAGRIIAAMDASLNDPASAPATRRRSGVAAAALLVIAAFGTGALLHLALAALPLGAAIEAVAVAMLMAQASLVGHVRVVRRALESEGLAAGRRAVSQIVGRDVTVLDEPGVCRAAIESLAENFSDGVVAPAFWYAALGLPGLLLYKAVNTADSMIGYRTPRHEAFGFAAAKLDDLLNLIPARLSAVLIAAAAGISRLDARSAVRAALRDAPRHASPNAGWPEAAAAGALHLALGGPRRYGAALVDGVWLNGDGRRDAGPRDIARALRLVDLAWGLLVVLVIALAWPR